jgi:hypothetical protein
MAKKLVTDFIDGRLIYLNRQDALSNPHHLRKQIKRSNAARSSAKSHRDLKIKERRLLR